MVITVAITGVTTVPMAIMDIMDTMEPPDDTTDPHRQGEGEETEVPVDEEGAEGDKRISYSDDFNCMLIKK